MNGMVVLSADGKRQLVRRRPVDWLVRTIQDGYLPRGRWDMKAWLAVLRFLDRFRFTWRRVR